MSTQHPTLRARRSRWLGIAAAVALGAAAAAGITTLRHNTAHAVYPADDASGTAGGPVRPLPTTLAGARPQAWQAAASDASLPSAHEVFKARAAPDSDVSAPTF